MRPVASSAARPSSRRSSTAASAGSESSRRDRSACRRGPAPRRGGSLPSQRADAHPPAISDRSSSGSVRRTSSNWPALTWRTRTRAAPATAKAASVSPGGLVCDTVQELPAVGVQRRASGLPALVEDAANQQRQLSGELGRLLYGEAVAKHVQEPAQHPVRLVPVTGLQLGCDIVDPDVGLLDTALEDLQVGGGGHHGLLERVRATLCAFGSAVIRTFPQLGIKRSWADPMQAGPRGSWSLAPSRSSVRRRGVDGEVQLLERLE